MSPRGVPAVPNACPAPRGAGLGHEGSSARPGLLQREFGGSQSCSGGDFWGSQLTFDPSPQLISSVDPKFLRLTKVDERIYEEFRKTFRDLRVDVLDPEELKSEPAKAVSEIWGVFSGIWGVPSGVSLLFWGILGVLRVFFTPRSGARSASVSRAWWRISTTGRCCAWIPAGNTRRKTPFSVGIGAQGDLGDPRPPDLSLFLLFQPPGSSFSPSRSPGTGRAAMTRFSAEPGSRRPSRKIRDEDFGNWEFPEG